MFCARLLGDARDQPQLIDGHSQIRTEISLPSGPTVVIPRPDRSPKPCPVCCLAPGLFCLSQGQFLDRALQHCAVPGGPVNNRDPKEQTWILGKVQLLVEEFFFLYHVLVELGKALRVRGR